MSSTATANSDMETPLRMRQMAREPSVWLAAAVGGYVVLAPSVQAPGVEMYDGKRLLELALLLGAGVALVASRRLRSAWQRVFSTLPAAARIGFAAVLSLGVLSAVFAPRPRYALLEVGHWVLLAGLTGGIAYACRRFPDVAKRIIVAMMAFSVALYAVRFMVGYVLHLVSGAMPVWPEASLGFSHTRFFNQYQTWTLPFIVLVPVWAKAQSTTVRVSSYGLAAFWWMLLWASGGRGTTLAMLGAMVAVGLLFGWTAWPWLKRQLAALAGGGALFVLLFRMLTDTQASLADRSLTSDSARFEKWDDALDMMFEAPVLGKGPMHYAFFPYGMEAGHPHNVVLQWGAEWGLLALVLVMVLAAWGLWKWTRDSQVVAAGLSEGTFVMIRVALTAALLAGGAHAMVSGITIMPVSQILMAAVIGWAWAEYSSKPISERNADRSFRSTQVVFAAALMAVVFGVAADIPTLGGERKAQYHEKTDSVSLRPRFWQQGYFGLGRHR